MGCVIRKKVLRKMQKTFLFKYERECKKNQKRKIVQVIFFCISSMRKKQCKKMQRDKKKIRSTQMHNKISFRIFLHLMRKHYYCKTSAPAICYRNYFENDDFIRKLYKPKTRSVQFL